LATQGIGALVVQGRRLAPPTRPRAAAAVCGLLALALVFRRRRRRRQTRDCRRWRRSGHVVSRGVTPFSRRQLHERHSSLLRRTQLGGRRVEGRGDETDEGTRGRCDSKNVTHATVSWYQLSTAGALVLKHTNRVKH
ncbi:unnamed protein product, partial [Ectocarpus sp. 12 AP-2014]